MEFYILTGFRDFTETTSHAKENYVAYPFIHDQMYRWSWNCQMFLVETYNKYALNKKISAINVLACRIYMMV